jgi:hypothetical protein
VTKTMPARFSSTCTCGEPIHRGETIRYTPGMVATHDACGDPTEDAAPTRARAARGRGRRPVMFFRCTHEDYPCCGCGPDAGR